MAVQNTPTPQLDEESDRSPSFPSGYYLAATTTAGVYSWDGTGIKSLFRSDSRGIIASRKASNILAVADGRVVILHDVDKGLPRRSYRLKARDVGPSAFPFEILVLTDS